MEKIKCLILFLFVAGCTPNDKTATDYYVLGNPLYDYNVEEKIKIDLIMLRATQID